MKKFIKYTIFIIFTIIIISLFILFGSKYGYNMRILIAETILSSQHRGLVKYTMLSQSDINKLLDNINNPKFINISEKDTIDLANVIKQKGESNDLILKKLIDNDFKIVSKKNILSINIEDISKNYSDSYYYKGKIMYISNPLDVKLVSSAKSNEGEPISALAQRYNAIASINASGFVDLNGLGNGGSPIGIIIQDGKIINTPGDNDKKDFISGITKDGVLITGVYSANELINMNIIYAAGFKPQLIVNGKKMITDGDGGWGIAPRTAIGQKADGSIIFLVIDGRQTHSIGATLKEVQDILYDRGVINAMCMDGGASSLLYFNNEIVTIPATPNHQSRYLPNAWIVTSDNEEVVIKENGNVIDQKNKINIK
jgi:exopolysaccharide biosynthesis protein